MLIIIVIGVVAICMLIGWVLDRCGVRVRPVETRTVDGVSITGVFYDER